MTKHERLQFLARVAEHYYVEDRSQAEIARILGYSRSAISRLLTEARQVGVVDIRINHPLQRDNFLERKLREKFGLDAARVVIRGDLDYERMVRQLGKTGATYVEDHLPDQGVIGVSWGTTVYEVVNAIQPRRMRELSVVQLMGAIGNVGSLIDGPEVVRNFARVLGAHCHTLNAPLIVDGVDTRIALESGRNIQDTLALAEKADMAVVGIGGLELNRSSLFKGGYLEKETLERIKAHGGIGDICVRHYDIHGHMLDIDINDRVIGVDIQKLAFGNCHIVGIAGGRMKAQAILGALRGGYLDVLITDSSAAEQLLAAQTNGIH